MFYQEHSSLRYEYLYLSLILTILLSLIIVACETSPISSVNESATESELKTQQPFAISIISTAPGELIQITDDETLPSSVDVSDNYVVWTQRPSRTEFDANIWLYDVKSKVKTQLTNSASRKLSVSIS